MATNTNRDKKREEMMISLWMMKDLDIKIRVEKFGIMMMTSKMRAKKRKSVSSVKTNKQSTRLCSMRV